MKDKKNSQPKSGQKIQSGEMAWESESKKRFLRYCKEMDYEPTKEEARNYLYGDNGSIEATEEPIPDWYEKLPEK